MRSISASVIIVAAGTSQRMGVDKLAAQLGDRSVLQRTVDAFLHADSIAEVIVVCPLERWKKLNQQEFSKPVCRVDGGNQRQDSVMAGLAMISETTRLVVVHDGARPLVLPSVINKVVESAKNHGAVALARRVTETLIRANSEDFSTEHVPRENLWCMETPQVFELALLREAYRMVKERNLIVTDEVSALQHIGLNTKLIESLNPNLKITTPADLTLAEALLR